MRFDDGRDLAYGGSIGFKVTFNQSTRKGIAMNLSDFPPFDESVLNRAITPGPIGSGTVLDARSRAILVQSNMASDWTPDAPDALAVRNRAEFMRTAYLRAKLEAFWDAIEGWFERQQDRELEDYLADSQNLADLETRMRRHSIKRNAFGLNSPNFD
jgi:hypothetical protein